MSNKKQKNRIANELVSFVTIILLLTLILALTLTYETAVTANVVRENSITEKSPIIEIKEVNRIKELSYLNEGWYHIVNGYVYYLEDFNSYVPLYIRVKNTKEQNGLLLVEADGIVSLDEAFRGLPGNQIIYDKKEVSGKEENTNQITVEVTGLEKVSGFSIALNPQALDFNNYKINKDKNPIVVKRENPQQIVQNCLEARCNDCVNNQCVIINQNQVYIKGRDVPVTIDKQVTKSNLLGTYVIVQDNSVYELEVKKLDNNYLELVVGMSTTKIPASLLNKVDFDTFRYNSDSKIISITTLDGDVRTISEVNDIFTASDKKGTAPTRQIEVEVLRDGIFTTTTTNPNQPSQKIEKVKPYDSGTETIIQTGIGANTKTTSTYKFADGIERIIEGKQESTIQNLRDNINSMTFTLSNGKKIEISKDAFETFVSSNDADQIRLLRATQDLGITKIDYKEGVLQQESLKIFTQDNIIYAVSGESLVSSSYIKTYTNYENTKFDLQNKQPTYQAGSRVIQTEDGNLRSVREYVTQEAYTEFKYQGDKQRGYTSAEIYENNNRLGILNLQSVLDDKSLVYGMYPFENYYLQASYGPFGLRGTDWYDKNGKKLTNEEIKQANLPKASDIESAINQVSIANGKPTPAQSGSQTFFANIERVFTEFQGLGYYSTLFFDENSLLQWRDKVDRAFATLYLGTEYWSSAICSGYINGQEQGIAYAETPQGLAQVAAHIEATKTEAIQTDKGIEFIYKITFNVRNGDFDKDPRAPEEMNINVVLKGDRNVNIFKQDKKIKRGSQFGRTGSNAIVQDSPFQYSQVCITFDNVPLRWKLDNKELCNKIVESAGEATAVGATSTGTATSGGTGGTAEDINDF